MRKIKKSEGTGSGADDVYVPKWKFYQECAFLQDVINSNRPTFSNLESVTVDDDESSETTESERSILSEEPLYPKKAKKAELPWMETAATALSELAKGTLSSPKQEEDEWDVFGRDVANSMITWKCALAAESEVCCSECNISGNRASKAYDNLCCGK